MYLQLGVGGLIRWGVVYPPGLCWLAAVARECGDPTRTRWGSPDHSVAVEVDATRPAIAGYSRNCTVATASCPAGSVNASSTAKFRLPRACIHGSVRSTKAAVRMHRGAAATRLSTLRRSVRIGSKRHFGTEKWPRREQSRSARRSTRKPKRIVCDVELRTCRNSSRVQGQVPSVSNIDPKRIFAKQC